MAIERQADDTNNPWWGEHIHRYEEVVRILSKDKLTILDIACGNGFGSNYLTQQGNKVIGADISKEVIEGCNKKYAKANLLFEVIDGTNISYNDESFDVVISFETIEHTTEYEKMLSEFKRVTKKNGTVIISTPNFLINSPKGIIENPYHTQEWIYEDLLNLLKSVFPNVKLFGQKYTRYENKKNKWAKMVESILYMRGIRKLPISVQNSIMKLLIGKPIYPLANDYTMVDEITEIKKCKTFFAICTPW